MVYCVLYGLCWAGALTHASACGGQRLMLDVCLSHFSTLFYFMYIDVLPAFMSVHHMSVWYLGRPEKDVVAPRTEFTDG